jgi:hypothetical protein
LAVGSLQGPCWLVVTATTFWPAKQLRASFSPPSVLFQPSSHFPLLFFFFVRFLQFVAAVLPTFLSVASSSFLSFLWCLFFSDNQKTEEEEKKKKKTKKGHTNLEWKLQNKERKKKSSKPMPSSPTFH